MKWYHKRWHVFWFVSLPLTMGLAVWYWYFPDYPHQGYALAGVCLVMAAWNHFLIKPPRV